MEKERNFSQLIQKQREFFLSAQTLSEDFRRNQLKKLKKSILDHEKEIEQALKKDLNKSAFESYSTEIGFVLEEISFMEKNLHDLMKKRRVKTSLVNFPSKSTIYQEPYGCVLIISPWNYPFQLAIAPLIGSIAAGNCSILKPSEYSPATSLVLEKIIKEIFPEEYVSVVQGEKEVNQALLELDFDYIFFTGGTRVGKIVMEKAAKHLTPVSLELGGKSPCIVDKTADLPLSAKRISWGKLLNAGQTCVAPDYILVQEEVREKLISELEKSIQELYSKNPLENPDYPKIISKRHFDRIKRLLEQSKIIYGGAVNPDKLQIEPSLVEADWSSAIMQEEIFGPILPILSFNKIDDLIQKLNRLPKALALYLFTKSEPVKEKVLQRVSFGGGCINDTIMHLVSSSLPFGGVGASGMGAYHGKYSFETFSHEKSILEKSLCIDFEARYSPHSERDFKLLKKFMK